MCASGSDGEHEVATEGEGSKQRQSVTAFRGSSQKPVSLTCPVYFAIPAKHGQPPCPSFLLVQHWFPPAHGSPASNACATKTFLISLVGRTPALRDCIVTRNSKSAHPPMMQNRLAC